MRGQKFSAWSSTINSLVLLTVFLCERAEAQVMAAPGCIVSMRVGESIMFPFTTNGDQKYEAELTFKSVLLVSWNREQVFITENYVGRIHIENNTTCLDKVELEDSGFYKLTVYDFAAPAPQSTQTKTFGLQVFEPVSKPNISVECQGDNVSVSCSSTQGTNVTYTWESLPPCGDACFVGPGPDLEIIHSSPLGLLQYMCTAQNQVSRVTSDPVDLEMCTHQSTDFPWMLLLCAVISALFLIGLVAYGQKRKRKKRQQGHASTVQPVTDEQLLPAPVIEPVYVSKVQTESWGMAAR